MTGEQTTTEALNEAIVYNNLEKVRDIISKEGFSGINGRHGDSGLVPLHHACYSGGDALVELLLSHGADVNARDKIGSTPLHIACAESYDQRPEDKKEKVSRLITHGEFHLAHLLLEHGADGILCDSAGETPLDIIVENANSYAVDDEDRQRVVEWYREHHPDLVLEAYCTQSASPGS